MVIEKKSNINHVFFIVQEQVHYQPLETNKIKISSNMAIVEFLIVFLTTTKLLLNKINKTWFK